MSGLFCDCAVTTTVLEHSHQPRKNCTHHQLLSTPTHSRQKPNPQATTHLPSLYRLAYFGHFIKMLSWNLWPFMAGFFHLAQCFQSFSTLSSLLGAKSCPTLCNPMDGSSPGSSVPGILQVRILEWVAIPYSRGSSWPRDKIWVSCIAGRFFTVWGTREA